MKKLGKLVFVRHGESIWNKTDPERGLITRFTGWADIPLTDLGKLQAFAAGRCLLKLNFPFNAVYTSLLTRARETFDKIASQYYADGIKDIQVVASWRLNERHYGSLIGLSKVEAEEKLGREKVLGWRRSWDLRPPPMTKHPYYINYDLVNSTAKKESNDCFDWQSDIWTKAMTISTEFDHEGKRSDKTTVDRLAQIPASESLADTADRVLPLWKGDILPRLIRGENVLVIAHSNTIRSIVKHIDRVQPDRVGEIIIPSCIPLLYTFYQDETSGEIHAQGTKKSTLGMLGRFFVTKELLELSVKANQNLEMSENLDESDSFKDMLLKALHEMLVPRAGTGNSNKTSFDVPESVSERLMDAEWMTFPIKNRKFT